MEKNLGSIVMWSVAPNQRFNIKEVRKLKKLKKHYLPPEVSASKSFRKAIRIVSKSPAARLYRFKTIIKANNSTIIGVVKEKVRTAEEQINYNLECKIKLVRDRVEIEGEDSKRLGADVKSYFADMFDFYTSRDINELLKCAVDIMEGISLRTKGGVYFVPESSSKDLKELKQALESLKNIEISIFQIDNSDHSYKSLIKTVEFNLQKNLKILQTYADSYLDDDSNPQQGTLSIQIEETRLLEKQCRYYSKLLNIDLNDLEEKAYQTGEAFRKILGEKQDKQERIRQSKKNRPRYSQLIRNPVD